MIRWFSDQYHLWSTRPGGVGSVYQYLNESSRRAIASRVPGASVIAVAVPEVEQIQHGEVGRVPEVVDRAEDRCERVRRHDVRIEPE